MGKMFRQQVEAIKRRKLAEKKVVPLDEFRKTFDPPQATSILVVDDDPIMRNALKRILEAQNFSILLAGDGLELSNHIDQAEFQLVLMDINLPWVDGYELCSLIKANPHFSDIPVVLISGRNHKEDIEKAFASGADNYIAKPFDIQQMIDIVDKIVKKPKPK